MLLVHPQILQRCGKFTGSCPETRVPGFPLSAPKLMSLVRRENSFPFYCSVFVHPEKGTIETDPLCQSAFLRHPRVFNNDVMSCMFSPLLLLPAPLALLPPPPCSSLFYVQKQEAAVGWVWRACLRAPRRASGVFLSVPPPCSSSLLVYTCCSDDQQAPLNSPATAKSQSNICQAVPVVITCWK